MLDEDSTGKAPTYFDSGPAGFAVGAIGVASAGIGLWLWLRGGQPAGPMIAVQRGGGTLWWSHRF